MKNASSHNLGITEHGATIYHGHYLLNSIMVPKKMQVMIRHGDIMATIGISTTMEDNAPECISLISQLNGQVWVDMIQNYTIPVTVPPTVESKPKCARIRDNTVCFRW